MMGLSPWLTAALLVLIVLAGHRFWRNRTERRLRATGQPETEAEAFGKRHDIVSFVIFAVMLGLLALDIYMT